MKNNKREIIEDLPQTDEQKQFEIIFRLSQCESTRGKVVWDYLTKASKEVGVNEL